MGISDLEKIFKDKSLLELALTHKSWVNEHPNGRGSNERLEFLGDSILEFLVSKRLYEAFPDKEEGFLTALRASLVNTQNLSLIAEKLEVGKSLFLSKGEEDGGGRTNPSLLADTVEAIIGAFYIDSGLESVLDFLEKNLFGQIPQKASQPLKDAKSRLQELVQAKGASSPRYIVVEESGPDHNKKFVMEVVVDGTKVGRGEGKSKSEAEQEAAKSALKSL
jgi:ribonuclease-3